MSRLQKQTGMTPQWILLHTTNPKWEMRSSILEEEDIGDEVMESTISNLLHSTHS